MRPERARRCAAGRPATPHGWSSGAPHAAACRPACGFVHANGPILATKPSSGTKRRGSEAPAEDVPDKRPGREFRTRAQGGRSVPERGFVAKITQISRTRRAAARERTISPCPTYNSQSHAPHGRPRAGGPTSAHPQAAPRKPPLPANPQTARKRAAGTRGGGRQHTRAHAARHQARRATCLGRKPAHRTSAR